MNDRLRKALVVIFSLIAIGCTGYLIWYYGSASRNADAIDEAKEIAEVVVEEEPEEEPEEVPVEEPVEIPINFKKLQMKNSDVHAWIKIEDTVIDYPIVQSEIDEYYLNRNWKKESASEGAIFTQKYNEKDFSDFNTVIYGHQMGQNIETMFHQLGNYLDEDFMESHREIIIYTPEHILTYKVFAAVIYDDRHLLLSTNLVTEKGRQQYLDSFLNSNDMRNNYCDDISVTPDDRIITLSTCVVGESNHRLLIGAVLIDEK